MRLHLSLNIVAAAALSLAACSERVAAGDQETPGEGWVVDMESSMLSFAGAQTGRAFEGEFEEFDATIVLDPGDLASASIDVTVDISSARTGDRQRDAALPGSDWFAVKSFPTARFLSDRVARNADGSYEARGRLTIRDVTRDLVLPFTLEIDGDVAHAKGGTTIIRTDYGVGQGEFATGRWVGLEVEIAFDITARR